MSTKPKQYGLVLEPIQIGRDYILGGYGSLQGDILQPDGQWLDYLPSIESQLDLAGFDAMACATFGTLNAIEMLARRMYAQDRNWSDRFLAKVSDTTPQGNSPHKVAETLRKYGAPNEIDYAFSKDFKTWDEFYSIVPQAIYSLAIAFLNEFDFKHEYVLTQPFYLKQALTKSPVGISVSGWFKGEDGLYYFPKDVTNNHWCVLVGYEEGKHWLIFDSYNVAGEGDESYIKKVKWDSKFAIAKRYSLNRQIVNEKSWIQYLIQLVLAAFDVKPKQTAPPVPVTLDETLTPPKYAWDTREAARHSVRLICDEMGLTVEQKNLLCQVIHCESGFDVNATHKNSDSRKTTDYGICMFNSYWYQQLISPEEALHNPEKAVRLMIKQMKAGHLKDWVCYSTGMYKSHPA